MFQKPLFQGQVVGWPLAIFRIYIGVYFLLSGWGKIMRGDEWPPIMLRIFEGNADKTFAFYQSFLDAVVIPNAGLFAYLVAYGEFALGLALIAGFATRLASILGIFMVLNFCFMKGLMPWRNLDHDWVLVWIFLIFAITTVGRVLGVDRVMHQRKPMKWLW